MSTTFGVEVEGKLVKVAFRWYGGKDSGVCCKWVTPLAALLPDSMPVIALDNTPQGVYTIKDLKQLIDND